MVECQAIKPGGACYDESIRAQASFAMNSYYQTKGRNDNNCDFSGTAVITTVDPSTLKFPLSFLIFFFSLVEQMYISESQTPVQRRKRIQVSIH